MHCVQAEFVLPALQDPFPAQLADLRGHCAALHLQIIRQCLPVKGDGKPVAALRLGLLQKIGHQLFPGGALGGDLDLLVQDQIVDGHQMEQIVNDLAVECAGIAAAHRDAAAVQKKYLGIFVSNDTDRQRGDP